jgi:GTPase
MKSGTVALIGRPNTGKSTLVNNLVGQKVAITSPKPQTTQFPIYAVFEDDRGQIVFVDTPGIFARTPNELSREGNDHTKKILDEEVDVLIYMVDHTRERGMEENRVLGMIRNVDKPKVLVINKIDKREPSFIEQYKFMEDEFDHIVEISALKPLNLSILLSTIFELLPDGEAMVERETLALPSLNLDSKLYVEESIREKAFLRLRKEVPYKIRVIVDEMSERANETLYIKARIITFDRYKRMIIGTGGSKIKEIGSMARRELELARGKKVFLDLTVETEKEI